MDRFKITQEGTSCVGTILGGEPAVVERGALHGGWDIDSSLGGKPEFAGKERSAGCRAGVRTWGRVPTFVTPKREGLQVRMQCLLYLRTGDLVDLTLFRG
jgi:hypothetical protein